MRQGLSDRRLLLSVRLWSRKKIGILALQCEMCAPFQMPQSAFRTGDVSPLPQNLTISLLPKLF